MKDFLDLLSEQSPVVVIVGILILYAMRDLGAKLKKIEHIDTLVIQVTNLVSRVDNLISSNDRQNVHYESEIKAIQLDLKQLHDRVLRLETKQTKEN